MNKIAPSIFAILLGSALPAYPANNAVSVSTVQTLTPNALVICGGSGQAAASCTKDGYTIDVSDCKGDALYGVVASTGGVALATSLSPSSKDLTARLKKGQFVCIAATARKAGDQRHYVVAIPTASVPRCKGNDLCKGGDKAVLWERAGVGDACRRFGKNGDYAGQCAAGWVNEADLDQYANGL